jgi:hypothetical protein
MRKPVHFDVPGRRISSDTFTPSCLLCKHHRKKYDHPTCMACGHDAYSRNPQFELEVTNVLMEIMDEKSRLRRLLGTYSSDNLQIFFRKFKRW